MANDKTFVQRNRLPLVFIALGAIALIVSIALAISANRSPSRDLDFTLTSLDGNSISLSDYRGQTVAVNFWASWCVPCREEMTTLAAYYRDHADEGFTLIAVNVGESADTAQRFVDELDVTLPIALDSDGDLSDQVGISGLPVTLIIDPNGQIAYRHAGLITPDLLEAKVQEASKP